MQVILVHYDGCAAASTRGIRIHKNARVKTWLAAAVRAFKPNLMGCDAHSRCCRAACHGPCHLPGI